jgi:hypothetical protein
MLGMNLRFVTALTREQFSSYVQGIPYEPFAELIPKDKEAKKRDVAEYLSDLARC